MNTRFVGIKEFRQNMVKISGEARRRHQRLIVLRRNQPLFELRPIDTNQSIEHILAGVEEGRRDAREGRVYSTKEVERLLGIA